MNLKRPSMVVVVGVIASVVVPVATLTVESGPAAAANCAVVIGGNHYAWAPASSNYPGGIDGSRVTINWGSLNPVMCSQNPDHTLETVFLWLPHHDLAGDHDTVENGGYEGYLGTLQGTYFITPTANLYWYQQANLYSTGISVTQVESNVVGTTHLLSHQEETLGCPSSCKLYDQAMTDSTSWTLIALPSGDNPGYMSSYQGEVFYHENDMGSAAFTNPQYHTGSWYGWNNLYGDTVSPNYCEYNTGGYNFENWGPC